MQFPAPSQKLSMQLPHGVPKGIALQTVTQVAAASAGVGATIEVTRGRSAASPTPIRRIISRRE